MGRRSKKPRSKPTTPLRWIDDTGTRHYCYWLTTNYVGYTVNPMRRQRQHQRVIRGGAKKTMKMFERDPKLHIGVLVSGFLNKRDALKYERAWQRSGRSISARMNFVASRNHHTAGHKWSGPSIAVDDPLRAGRPIMVTFVGARIAPLPLSSALCRYRTVDTLERAVP